ncbi:cellulose synthase complex outer membrane protein BcsC [Aeromonas sp. R6-2]|uniref:cellulose synthase complex outer membrane protein BcsC n=3 Tax=unclassified Aeromonas TaxID=257493 RepID=UPI0034A23226
MSALSALCLLGALLGSTSVRAEVEPVSWLLGQIRLGEATGREDLVSNSLYSLSLIEGARGELLAAQARQALRLGKVDEARRLLGELGKLAPDSPLYRQGMANLALNEPAKRQQLQQARLLSRAGRLDEALSLYRSLLVEGQAPNLELAVEYALLQASIPSLHRQGMAELVRLNRDYPGQPALQAGLADHLLADGRQREAFTLLEKMAQSPFSRGSAASLWLGAIRDMPVGESSIAALERFITVFGSGDEVTSALAMLEEQQSRWASPAFRARQRALAGEASLAELKRALAANPDDVALIGALGQAYSRANQRALAIAQFERVLREPGLDDRAKWQGLLDTNRYWLLLEQADGALERGEASLAAKRYRQAVRLDAKEAEGWLGLGDANLALGDEAAAEQAYGQARRLVPGDSRPLLKLFALYRARDPERALDLIEGSPALAAQGKRLRSELLQQQADSLAEQGEQSGAQALRQQALTLTPEDPWLTYRVASTLAEQGEAGRGELMLRGGLALYPRDAAWYRALALYLSGQERPEEGRRVLARLPKAQWSEEMGALDRRLQREQTLTEARRLHQEGQLAAAEAHLRPLLPDPEALLLLAGWAAQRGEGAEADAFYRRLLEVEPGSLEARIGLAELALDRGDRAAAREWLPPWPDTLPPIGEAGGWREVANLYQALGESARAEAIFTAYAPSMAQASSRDSALFWRDGARQRFATGQTGQAIELDRKAMAAAGLIPDAGVNEGDLTRATRAREGEEWLAASLRADLDRHYRQSQTTVSFDSDYWGSSGTGGTSDLRALTQMLQLDTPWAGGTLFGRIERVDMDAGHFSGQEKFGTCVERLCTPGDQQAQGTLVAAGWHKGRWAFDLGTTPLGFEVVDWSGGASVQGDLGDLGWTFTLSRRPVTSSLLSYAGTMDPGTGTVWGGVRANGARLDLSHDLGGAVGYWGSLQQHLLTGENVPDNWRTRLMGGGYYKFIHQEHRRASVGLNTMLWHYQRDLGGYTLGQGGYYSPQRYFSLSLPVSYRQRSSDWSWEVNGSLSWSRSRSDDTQRYPISGLVPPALPDRDAIERGGGSSGFGYTLGGLVEYRLTDHWRIGARIDIQQADDYAPSHGTLFLRYSFKPWQGDLDMPPRPLTPYGEFD